MMQETYSDLVNINAVALQFGHYCVTCALLHYAFVFFYSIIISCRFSDLELLDAKRQSWMDAVALSFCTFICRITSGRLQSNQSGP